MRSPAALRGKSHSCSLTVSENRTERTPLGAEPGVDTQLKEKTLCSWPLNACAPRTLKCFLLMLFISQNSLSMMTGASKAQYTEQVFGKP